MRKFNYKSNLLTSPKITINNCIKRFENLSNLRFITELYLIWLVGAIFTSTLYLGLTNSSINTTGTTDISSANGGFSFVSFSIVVILVPIIETIIDQLLFVSIASFFTKFRAEQWLISTLAFAAFHSFASGFHSFLTHIVGAGILAFAFIVKRKESLWTAFWVTSMLHGIWNFQVVMTSLLWSY